MVMRRLLLMVLVGASVAGCSTSDYKAPASFTVSDTGVANVVSHAINDTSDSPGLAAGPDVRCQGESTCDITYTVKEPAGINNDLELVDPTRQIWAAMFEDSQFQSGKIKVDGPVTTTGGKSQTSALFTLSCDRSAAQQIDWSNVDGKGLRSLCDYEAQVSGL